MPIPSHESPILVVLKHGERPGEALRTLLAHPVIAHHVLPPMWALEREGIDLVGALPEVRSVTLETLPRVTEALVRLATPEVLDGVVERMWGAVDEQVRLYYLKRPLGATLAAMFRFGPKAVEVAPPPQFREDRIHDASFEIQYRIERAGGPHDPLAPEEEASVVLYPFDPANASARREASLGEGTETVLEVFAYESSRARHREALDSVARTTGWRIVDPAR
jgi:hypothetical protein